MTNQDLNELIQNPSMLALVDTQELQNMAEKFPFFQNIRFLAVKKHLMIQSPQYEKYLNVAATYASDRTFLYDYLYEIETDALPTGNLDGLHQEADIDFEVVIEEEEEEDLEGGYYDDFEEIEEEAEHAVSDDEGVGEQPTLEEDIDFRLKSILNKIGETPSNSNLDDAISRIRNMKLGNFVSDEKPQPTPATGMTEEEKIFHFHSTIEELEDGGLEKQDLLGDFPDTFISEHTSFQFLEIDDYEEEYDDDYIEELKLAMRKKHIERLRKSVEAFFKLDEELQTPEVEEQIIGGIPDDISFKDWMKSLKKSYEQEPLVHTSEIEEQIVSSIEEDDDLMSEELAKLLASQGNKGRAIEMYQHLSLKFPEKKAFFAQKIKDLNH